MKLLPYNADVSSGFLDQKELSESESILDIYDPEGSGYSLRN